MAERHYEPMRRVYCTSCLWGGKRRASVIESGEDLGSCPACESRITEGRSVPGRPPLPESERRVEQSCSVLPATAAALAAAGAPNEVAAVVLDEWAASRRK